LAFTRPTLTQIIDRIKNDFKAGLGLTAIIRRSFLDVMSKAYGAASHVLHGHIEYAILRKFFPDTGDEETVLRWGTLFNVTRKDATFAELTVEFTGTTGNTLTLPTTLVRSDGLLYDLQTETIVPAGGTAQANVVCQTEGETGNMDNGDTLALQSPVTGVETNAEVVATVTEGEEQETIEDYQTRVLERMANPPSGGTVNDYIAFAKTVAGVTRAWVLPAHLGEGTVGLTFVEDNEDPIIPDQAKVDEVQEAVLELQPINADLFTFAPIEYEMNPEIQLKPNTQEVRDAVIAELEDLLAREAQVRDASDPEQVGLGVQYDGKIKLSQINEAISIADGEEDHVLISPTSDVQPSVGGLVTLGTPVFSTLP
jgi:uncharacterized phage protein gp47/JayE